MRISHHLLWAYLMITSSNDNNLPNGPDFHLYGTYQPTLHEVHPKLSLSCFVWNHHSQLPFDIRTQWWTEIYLLGGNTYWDQGGFQHLAYQLVPALKLKKAQGCLACTLVALVQWKGLNYWSIEHLYIWFVYQNPCFGLAWWTITGSVLRIRAHSC